MSNKKVDIKKKLSKFHSTAEKSEPISSSKNHIYYPSITFDFDGAIDVELGKTYKFTIKAVPESMRLQKSGRCSVCLEIREIKYGD